MRIVAFAFMFVPLLAPLALAADATPAPTSSASKDTAGVHNPEPAPDPNANITLTFGELSALVSNATAQANAACTAGRLQNVLDSIKRQLVKAAKK